MASIPGMADIDHHSFRLIPSKLACNRMAPLHLSSHVCDADDFAATSTRTSGTVSKMAIALRVSKGFGGVS